MNKTVDSGEQMGRSADGEGRSARSSAPAVSSKSAVIVDAGVGNLGNLRRAMQHVSQVSGAASLNVEVTEDPQVVGAARILLLPGVGAFRPPRERLRGELEDALTEALAQGAFMLGICVGFQLLFEGSDEFGDTDGLGLIPGRISLLPPRVNLPHIGWNRLVDCKEHPLLDGVHGEYAYFVHSFAPQGVPDDLQLAGCLHGALFPAVVARGRVMGTQFHPEKSGPTGLRILSNFLELAGAVK